MKLLFVTDNGFSEKDGSYYYSAPNYTHVKHLRKYFDEFVFLARNDKYDKSSFKIDSNFPVYLFNKYDFLGMQNKLEELIRDIDAVICYGFNGFLAYKIAKKHNKIVIAYNGGDAYDVLISTGTIKGRILAPIIRYLEKKKFQDADYAHYVDYFLAEKYPTSGKKLIASGVNIEINEENIKQRIEKINNLNRNSKIIIGLIGHTKNNLKGIDTAIKALAKLNGNFELQIVGRGEHYQYDKLAKKLGIRDQVKFLGTKKAGNELFSWLDSIDIYIQPSRIEGLPRATIEAMSRGCPIVSTNAGGLSRLIDKDYRIKINDYYSLSETILKLVNNKKLMIKQAKINFERSKEFSPEIREKKYNSFYNQITNEIKKIEEITLL